MNRILGILLSPEATWREIRATDPPWSTTLARHAVPLALLPSIAWPLGRAAQGATDPIVESFFATLSLSVASVVLLACGFYVLARFFDATRNWDRAVALAAYGGTPVFLCGAVLLNPILVIASVGGLFYGIGLCAIGARVMLDCRPGDVAAYVASTAVLFGILSMTLGALCGAIGLV